MKGQILVTFIVILFAMGCKKDVATDVGTLPAGLIGPHSNLYEAIQSINLTCSDLKNCPQNVGLVMGYDSSEQSIKYCTGFLIEPNAVVTSADCVDSDLIESQTCGQYIVVRFIDNTGGSQAVSCAKIRERRAGGVYDPNYAVIELSQTLSRPTLGIHREGLEDEQSIYVPKINMRGNNSSASLDVQKCRVGLKTLLHTKSINPWANTAIGIKCEAREGNWGAPVLNKNRQVIGILQNNWNESFSQEVSKNFRQFGVKDSHRIVSNILFANSSCIASLGSYFEREKCENFGTREFSECYKVETHKSEDSRYEIFDQWLLELPQIFVFKITTNEDRTKFAAEPICVKTKDQSHNYDQFVSQEGVWGFRSKKIVYNYPQKIEIRPRYSISENLKIDAEFVYELSQRTSNTIDIKRNKFHWQGNFQTSMNSGEYEGGRIVMPLSLRDCTLEQVNDGDQFLVERFNNLDRLNSFDDFFNREDNESGPFCQ